MSGPHDGARDPWAEQRRLPPAAGISGEPVHSCLAAGSRVWRIHAAGRDACEFNRAAPDGLRGGRFDSPSGAPGVLYASDTYQGAIAEVLLRAVPLADEGVRAVLARQVRGRLLSRLEVIRDIELVALHGAAAASVGQGLWLTKSDSADYPLTREWGAAIRMRAPEAAGFVWRARHDEDRFAYALYEDAVTDALRVTKSVAIGEGPGLEAVRSVLLVYRAVIEG